MWHKRVVLKRLREFIPWVISATGFPAIWGFVGHPFGTGWKLVWWAGGVALGLVSLWFALYFLARRRRRKMARGVTERYASPAESQNVWQICRGFYDRDDQVINATSLKAFMEKNGHTAKIFEKNNQVVGVSVIFSLNTLAMKDILSGKITSAQELGGAHAVKARPRALYVTNIAADEHAIHRGIAHRSLLMDLVRRVRELPTVEWVFARRGSADGGDLLDKYDFRKIDENGPDLQIWKLSRQTFLDRLKQVNLEEL